MMAINDNKRRSFAAIAQPYVTGGTAAVFSACVIHPIDLVKVHLQLAGQHGLKTNAFDVAKTVVRNEGFHGLYAGLSAAVLRQMVYGTARLGMHRAVSDSVQNYINQRERHIEKTQSLPLWAKSMIAMSTGAIAATLGCPMDVALVRMQADTMTKKGEKRGYKNVIDAIFRIAKGGGIFTLWRGSFPLIARGAGMNLGMMATYDEAKEFLIHFNGDNFSTQLGASAISGFACALTSLPFDLVKSRLMNMKPDVNGKLPYKGFSDCFSQIVKKEGFFKLWRGYWTYYARCAPNAMIVLLVIEQITSVYRQTFHLDY